MTRLGLLALFALAGCGEAPSEDGEPSAATRASWKLTLKIDGADVKLPLESMDVFLVDDDQYPELFEIVGPGVSLVGEFPKDLHVGYEGKWNRLFGKTIPILPQGGDPREPKESQVTLPGGSVLKVFQGSFTANKTTGKWVTDTTIWGKVTLLVRDEKGKGFTVEGEFAVHATTWG